MDNEKEQIVPSGSGDEPTEDGVEPKVKGSAESSDELAKLRAEKDALLDRLLRKQAEMENFRKRVQRERDDFLQHATADLIRALLPTLDGFDRALQHRDANAPQEFYQGLELIQKELLDVLQRAGLTRLDTVGKDFDPHVHQAVETVQSRQHRDHEVVEELQRGYKLKQRLLRPAIVKVAVAPHNGSQGGTRGEDGQPEGNL